MRIIFPNKKFELNPSYVYDNVLLLVDPDFSFLDIDNCAMILELTLDYIIFDSFLDAPFPP
jgi:hypothetical protein